MKPVLGRSLTTALLLAVLFGEGGCTGTNTGNASPECPASPPCFWPVSVTAPDGHTYRGMVSTASQESNSPQGPTGSLLEFSGLEVTYVDGSCRDDWPGSSARFFVDVAITGEGFIDASGALVMRTARRDGPSDTYIWGDHVDTRGWGADLTVTPAGELTATFSITSTSTGAGGAGGAGGADGTDGGREAGTPEATAPDAGVHVYEIQMKGSVAEACLGSAPVQSGVFQFPCRRATGC
ncbi:MAG TPA: hypothetical protein VHE30_25395 [Polyangiaceae bacterium]|nr:hypothetical protein [Polyangiaceae bacterium]